MTASLGSLRATGGITDVHKHFGGKNVSNSDSIMNCQYTFDGNWATAATAAGPVNFFSTTDARKTAVFNPLGLAEETLALSSFKLGRTARTVELKGAEHTAYLAASMTSGGRVQVFEIAPNVIGKSLASASEDGNEGLVVSLSNDDSHVATGGSDKIIRLYSTEGLELVQQFTQGIDRHGQDTLGHPNRIYSIKWVDSNTFLSGGWESSVLLFDTRLPHAVRAFEGPRISGDGIDFIHNAVVTASDRPENQLEIFDFGSGKLIGKPISLGTMLYSVRAVERDGALHAWVCGNNDNALFCIAIPSGKVVESVTGVEESLFSLDVSPTKNDLIFGGAHNALYTAKFSISE